MNSLSRLYILCIVSTYFVGLTHASQSIDTLPDHIRYAQYVAPHSDTAYIALTFFENKLLKHLKDVRKTCTSTDDTCFKLACCTLALIGMGTCTREYNPGLSCLSFLVGVTMGYATIAFCKESLWWHSEHNECAATLKALSSYKKILNEHTSLLSRIHGIRYSDECPRYFTLLHNYNRIHESLASNSCWLQASASTFSNLENDLRALAGEERPIEQHDDTDYFLEHHI